MQVRKKGTKIKWRIWNRERNWKREGGSEEEKINTGELRGLHGRKTERGSITLPLRFLPDLAFSDSLEYSPNGGSKIDSAFTLREKNAHD